MRPPDPAPLIDEAMLVTKAQVTYLKQTAQAVREKSFEKALLNEFQHALDNAVDHPATQELLKEVSRVAIAAMPQSQMMDANYIPELVSSPDSAGPVIYYINGIDTKHNEALAEAAAIGAKFGRPVALIYNVTEGEIPDVFESAYDRTWVFAPLTIGNPQANKATRQLAHVLYSSTGAVSLISHSQGCIISRNAFVTADAYGSDVKDRLSWVATGIPLKDVEVFVIPKKFTPLRNKDDNIAEAVGLQADPDTFSHPQKVAHSFIKSYLPLITPEQIGGSFLKLVPAQAVEKPLAASPATEATPTVAASPAQTPALSYRNAKWPDGRLLIHSEDFMRTYVTNVSPNDTLELRSGPGTRFDPVTKIPANGQGIVAFDQDRVWDGDTWWYPVVWQDFRGYVGRRYMSIDHYPALNYRNAKWPDGRLLIHSEDFMRTYVTNVSPNDTLELRSGPGTRFSPVAEISANGKDIVAFDQDRVWDGDTWWYPVMWQEFRGYVGRRYISIDH